MQRKQKNFGIKIRSRRYNSIVVAALWCVLWALPSTTIACTCRGYSAEQFVEQSDAIFTAQFVESSVRAWSENRRTTDGSGIISTGGSSPRMSVLRIIEILKAGDTGIQAGDIIFVLQESSNCSVLFAKDSDYLISGTEVLSNTFTTSRCTGSGEIESMTETITSIKKVLATQ